MAWIEAGRKLALEPRRLDLAEVVADTCGVFQAQIGAKARTLKCPVLPGLPPVYGDPDRLLQVFSNLIANAVKFTPEGGRIVLTASVVDAEIRVSTADTGPGIPPSLSPGSSIPTGRRGSPRGWGRGLGLTMTNGIVEAHGGRIWVESRPGEGTTFFFTLPLAEVGQPPAATPSETCGRMPVGAYYWAPSVAPRVRGQL